MLDPDLLFTIGSDFLDGTSSLAIRGTIRFRGPQVSESGSFQMMLNRGDSLMFLIEGPLKLDIFKLVVIDGTAYALERGSPGWTEFGLNDPLEFPEYGIKDITPFELGNIVFPQFYYQDSNINSSGGRIVYIGDKQYYLRSSPDSKSFTISNNESNIHSDYSKRKEISSGFFPSKIAVFQPEKKWKVIFEIDRVKINPNIPGRAWERN